MAQEIISAPSLSGGTLPSDAGSIIRGDEWGINSTLSNCIIQSEDISYQRMSDTTYDQKGATVSQLDIDEQWTLNLSFLCDYTHNPIDSANPAVKVGQIDFQYGGHTWKVTGISYSGAYNAKKMYTLTAERYKNFPTQL